MQVTHDIWMSKELLGHQNITATMEYLGAEMEVRDSAVKAFEDRFLWSETQKLEYPVKS